MPPFTFTHTPDPYAVGGPGGPAGPGGPREPGRPTPGDPGSPGEPTGPGGPTMDSPFGPCRITQTHRQAPSEQSLDFSIVW